MSDEGIASAAGDFRSAAGPKAPPGVAWPWAAAIAAAAIAAYRNTFSAPFVFLDMPAIVDNPTIRSLRPLGRVLLPPSEGGVTVGGRPVVNLSFAVNYALDGTGVWGYHALNLAIHILAGLALFGILRRTLPAGRTCLSFAIALLWTVHPLQTEAVTYVVQRAESLMGLFYLVTLYCFIRGVETKAHSPVEGVDGPLYQGRDGSRLEPEGCQPPSRPGNPTGDASLGTAGRCARRASLVWCGLAWLACLFGMATKEVMVSAPLIVLLYDRTFLSGTFREAWRRRWRLHLGLAGTWILLGFLVAGTGSRGGTAGFGLGFSWPAYVLTQFGAVTHYLRLAIWPHPLDFDYTARWIRHPLDAAPDAVLVAVLVAGTAWAFFRPADRGMGARALGFAGIWFFAVLAPTSLVPGVTQTMAEHRMYLALAPVLAAGVCLAAAVVCMLCELTKALPVVGRDGSRLGPEGCQPPSRPRAARRAAPTWIRQAVLADNPQEHSVEMGGIEAGIVAGALALALVFGLMTASRNRDYRSELALWADTAEKSPDNPYALNNLGIALVGAGRLPEAAARFEAAARLEPGYAEARNNLGLALARLGRGPEAVAQFQEALRIKPNYPEALANLGVALAASGRTGEAIDRFEAALRLRPDYADARNDLAVAFAGEGRLDEAIAQYEKVLEARPDSPETQYNLGNALAAKGRLPEAAAHYEAAVRLIPSYGEAQANLGAVLARLGRTGEAIARYELALKIDPGDADVHHNLGLALRAAGRISEAEAEFALAERLRAGGRL